MAENCICKMFIKLTPLNSKVVYCITIQADAMTIEQHILDTNAGKQQS